MAYRYRCKIAEMSEEKPNFLTRSIPATTQWSQALTVRTFCTVRASILASQSKAHFKQAVKLDGELKELINDGTPTDKD